MYIYIYFGPYKSKPVAKVKREVNGKILKSSKIADIIIKKITNINYNKKYTKI